MHEGEKDEGGGGGVGEAVEDEGGKHSRPKGRDKTKKG